MDGTPTGQSQAFREAAAVQLLGTLADTLDITATQHTRAEQAYGAVSDVVTKSRDLRLAEATVFPQGSFAIGTMVRPINSEDGELDVDLACRLMATSTTLAPAAAKRLLGDQLKTNSTYRPILEEKSRCWRLLYAGEFHLDICPLVTASSMDAIPDKELSAWILTHPERYAQWFNELANRVRPDALTRQLAMDAVIAPFPDQSPNKGWLRRVVQLLKRHRDQWRLRVDKSTAEFAPISIILTTLAAKVIEKRIRAGHQFNQPYEVIEMVLREMPGEIEQRLVGDTVQWWVQSPVAHENFANRWNADSRWAQAFEQWHQDACNTMRDLLQAEGLDGGKRVLTEGFGGRVASKVFVEYGAAMSKARDNGTLRYAKSGAGLATRTAVAGLVVPRHTFFGE